MAEAWTIVGVAVNVATIIDLGFKLVSAGISAHESINGTTREIETLSILLEDIQTTNTRLQATQKLTDGLYSSEPRFLSLAKECDKLVKELNHILVKLKIRKEAPSRTVESGRVAIQSWWKRKDIVAMKERLFEVERRLKDAVARVLSQYVFCTPFPTTCLQNYGISLQFTTDIEANIHRSQHSSVMQGLRALQAEGQIHERHTQYVKSQMDSIRHDIAALSTQVSEKDGGYAAQLYQIREDILQIVTTDSNAVPNSSCSKSLLLKLNAFTRERNSCITRLKVLKSLYFPELRRRFADITNAEANTLKWLYDRSETSFSHWLACQHGIY